MVFVFVSSCNISYVALFVSSKTKIGALESDIFNVLIYAYLSIESYKVIDSHTPGKEPSLELLLMRFNDFMGIIRQ